MTPFFRWHCIPDQTTCSICHHFDRWARPTAYAIATGKIERTWDALRMRQESYPEMVNIPVSGVLVICVKCIPPRRWQAFFTKHEPEHIQRNEAAA